MFVFLLRLHLVTPSFTMLWLSPGCYGQGSPRNFAWFIAMISRSWVKLEIDATLANSENIINVTTKLKITLHVAQVAFSLHWGVTCFDSHDWSQSVTFWCLLETSAVSVLLVVWFGRAVNVCCVFLFCCVGIVACVVSNRSELISLGRCNLNYFHSQLISWFSSKNVQHLLVPAC